MSDLVSLMQRANAQNSGAPIGSGTVAQPYQGYIQPTIFAPQMQPLTTPSPQADAGKDLTAALSRHSSQSGNASGKGGGSVTSALSNVAALFGL